MNKLKAEELARVSCFVIQSDHINGTVYQIFDLVYEIAKAFIKEFPVDYIWETHSLEYDEQIELFTMIYIQTCEAKIMGSFDKNGDTV